MTTSVSIKIEEKIKRLLKYIKYDELYQLIIVEKQTAGMVKDLLVRDHFELFDEKHFSVKTNYSLNTIRKCIQRLGLEVDTKYYLKQPNEWRYKNRFPENTPIGEIKKWVVENSRKGQKLTVKNRKTNNSYKNQSFKKKWSPLCEEFYLEKGFTKKEAQIKMNEIRVDGALNALKKSQKPKTEKKIAELLQNYKIEFSSQYRIITNEKKTYIFDFYIPKHNTLIEVNGTYWHCDPRFFKEEKEVFFPGQKLLAKQVWARDRKKLDTAQKKGYNVLVIWEHDLNKNVCNVRKILKGFK